MGQNIGQLNRQQSRNKNLWK